MKKVSLLLSILIALLLVGSTASAKVEAAGQKISLTQGQNTFTVKLAVSEGQPYAGAEFALTCNEGVSVQSVTYSKSGSTAGPVIERGFTWFSLFSSDNVYRGEITATLTCSYSGKEDTSIVFDHVDILVKNGVSVDVKTQDIHEIIQIVRESESESPRIIPVSGVTLEPNSHYLNLGSTRTLKTNVLPKTATNQNVSYRSSAPAVAEVSKNGTVKGIETGTAMITVQSDDGGKRASSKVTVYSYVTLRIGYEKAIYNEKKTTIDNSGTKPFILGGRTMIPLRFLGEKMGAKVTYVSDSKPIVISYQGKRVELVLNQRKVKVTKNNKTSTITIDVAVQKKNGKTYIPLRAIGQILEYTVYYRDTDKMIVVNSPVISGAVRTTLLSEGRAYIL